VDAECGMGLEDAVKVIHWNLTEEERERDPSAPESQGAKRKETNGPEWSHLSAICSFNSGEKCK